MYFFYIFQSSPLKQPVWSQCQMVVLFFAAEKSNDATDGPFYANEFATTLKHKA